MGEVSGTSGFEAALKLVGGHGRFQWLALAICAGQLMLMTWNHLGYIFIGAVPQHWCHVSGLEGSDWTEEQVKNISIPKIYSNGDDGKGDFKYDSCNYYKIDYKLLVEQSQGNFDVAYGIAHYKKHKVDNEISDDDNKMTSLVKGACERWTYDKSIYASTIVSEFDLVCGRRYLVASIQAFYMLAAFTGSLVFGPLNDKVLGRRRTTLVCIALVLIGGFLTAFSTSYTMFILTRCLLALGTAGCMQASSVWFLEYCDTKSRAKLYCISGMAFGVGYAIMPVYAYYFRNWSKLQMAFSVTSLSMLSFYWIYPESPRWLASKGRDEEAVNALLKIAKINGMPKPHPADLLEAVKECHENKSDDEGRKKSIVLSDSGVEGDEKPCEETNESVVQALNGPGSGSNNSSPNRRKNMSLLRKLAGVVKNFKSLCATKELRKISFTVWTLFVCVAFVYYGFAFTTNLTTNPYLLVSLGALMEVPASVVPIPFLSRWGRRPTTALCFLFTSLSAFAIAITPSHFETLRTIFSMSGKLFVATAFTVLYLVVSEVYPTVVRSTGQGAGTIMGRVGSIAAPFVADLLTTVYPDLPCIIFGFVALGATFVAMLLPEMKDVDMKDQVYQYVNEELPNA